MPIIDADGHLYEPRRMWKDYTESRNRDLALEIKDDELGYGMLTYRGDAPASAYAWVSRPTGAAERRANAAAAASDSDGGEASSHELIELARSRMRAQDENMGEPMRRRARGEKSLVSYDDRPTDFTDLEARIAKLDQWDVDAAILFPNWGLEFEALFFDDDLDGHRINLAAWNRYAGELQADAKQRLFPVGHLTMQGDQRWAIDQINQLGAAGVKFGFFTPALINDRRLSDPVNDPIWRAFVDNDLVMTFHAIVGTPRLLQPGWTDNDHQTFSALGFLFMYHPVQIAIADLIMNGVFDRFPDLRVALIEEDVCNWIVWLARTMDRYYISQPAITGFNVATLKMMPSDYIRKHCRIGPLAHEDVQGAMAAVGDIFMFGGDYPHFEGLEDTLRDFQELVGVPEDPAKADLLYGGNADWLINGSAR